MIKIKGHEFKQITIRDSYNRRAIHYQNQIISSLKKFRVIEDDIDVPLVSIAMKKEEATASWYMWDQHLYYSFNRSAKFVENLAMVSQVILYFLKQLGDEVITKEEFLGLFAEDPNVAKHRKIAREVLGVEEDSTDFEKMHKNFKKLSKEAHPDMPNGSTEKFKRLNSAHRILKNELN